MFASVLTLRWAILLSLCVALAALAGCGGAEARKLKHMQRGESYLADGNLEKARIEFRNALQIDPDNAEARYRCGVVAEKLKNIREAAGMYQATIDTDPSHVKAVAALSRIYLFSGFGDRALELVAPLLIKGEHAELLAVRGAVRLQKGEVEAARADALRAVELAPADANAVALLAAIHRHAGENAAALALLTRSLETQPDSVDLRVVLAQLYAQVEEWEKAVGVLREVIALRPKELPHHYQLAMLHLGAKQTDQAQAALEGAIAAVPDEVEPKLALAQFLVAHRSREQAERSLRQFIADDPENDELRFGLASLYELAGRPADAERVYREVIERRGTEPQGLTARNRLAALRVQANDFPAAEQLVAQVLEENARDNDALIIRGNIALTRGQPAAAINDLRAVLRDQQNAVPVLRALARAHLQNNEPALAEENLRRAIDANPRDVDTRIDMAQFMSQRGQAAQAVQMLEPVVRESPTNVAVRDALFRSQVTAQQWDAAARTAEDIKLLLPDEAVGFYFAGLVAQAQGRIADSAREYEQALKLQPDAAEALTALTRLRIEQKQVAAAIGHLESVRRKFPQNALVRNLLGEVQISQRALPEARAAFEEAIKLAPDWWPPYRGLALAHVAGGDSAKAIEVYKRGIGAAADTSTLTADLASMHEINGQPDAAVRLYEDLVSRAPNSAVAANNLAMLLVTYRTDQISLDRARDLMARFSSSGDPALINTLGWVKYKRGEYAAALPLLEQAVARVPESAVMRYHLGMAQYRAGQLDQARENLERSLKIPNRFAGIDEARTTLDQLKKKG